jgi:L,D-transpeptidase ErfK/SrfK
MYNIIITIIWVLTVFFSCQVKADDYFSTKLCESGQYDCIQVEKGDTWPSLFPDANERDAIKRFNRMNTTLKLGMYVAIPQNLEAADSMSTSPFPFRIEPPGAKLIVIDLSLLAWGAYDSEGKLLKWGPASGGRNWCYDIKAPCKTLVGRFQIYDIRGKDCISTEFPVNQGGAPMPYAMFFQGGYAIHGSDDVAGYNASHGCVRVFNEDAKWLNEEFVKTAGRTKVLVLPYDE